MGYIEFLGSAIKNAHGCESRHVRTVFVSVLFQGVTAWEGEVEVFELKGHPTAVQCYAWSGDDEKGGGDIRAIVVLALPPATTPARAIRLFVQGLANGKET
jgi:hypothetical protein